MSQAKRLGRAKFGGILSTQHHTDGQRDKHKALLGLSLALSASSARATEPSPPSVPSADMLESTEKHPSEEAKPAATHPRPARHVLLRFPVFTMSCTLSAATCSFLSATLLELLACAVLTSSCSPCWGLCSLLLATCSLVCCKHCQTQNIQHWFVHSCICTPTCTLLPSSLTRGSCLGAASSARPFATPLSGILRHHTFYSLRLNF